MTPSARSIRSALHAADRLSPALAGHIAHRLFFQTRPRMPLREQERATDLAARREHIRVRGRRVVSYRWGGGPRTVLVVHGWKGRASQFSPLVRELVGTGIRVVSFDAPAHGASPGRRTDIRDWLAAIEELDHRHGGFSAVVGHSVGAVAALTAARTDVRTPAVVAISGAAGPGAMLDEFSRTLKLSPGARAALEHLFARRVGAPLAVERLDSAIHPLPEATRLLVVHDQDDRGLRDGDSLRLHRAHPGRSRMLRTTGLGHNRILTDDAVLDAVVAFLTETANVPSSVGR